MSDSFCHSHVAPNGASTTVGSVSLTANNLMSAEPADAVRRVQTISSGSATNRVTAWIDWPSYTDG